MKEEWRDIPGYEGLYQASNLGRIRSLDHFVYRTNPHMKGRKKNWLYRGKIIKLRNDQYGYVRCSLSTGRQAFRYTVHRLVALIFIPNPCGFPQINHKDENKHNNTINNLEWCTADHNLSYKGGRQKRALKITGRFNPLISGENNYKTKLRNDQVIEMYKDPRNYKEIALFYGVHLTTVYDIKKKRKWKSVLNTI